MAEPRAGRPYMPDYGISEGDEGLLPWSWAIDLLRRVRNPVVSTVRTDGGPHAMPVWGLWLDSAFCFSTSKTSVKSRNLEADPRCVVTAGEGHDTLIIEGRAELSDLPPGFTEAYKAKYDHSINEGPIWIVHPTVAFGFVETEEEFARTATRWTFEGA